MTIEGEGLGALARDGKPPVKKPTLRHLCRALELFPANSLAIFQMQHEDLYKALVPQIPDIASWSEEQVLARIAELEEGDTSTAQAARSADAERVRAGQEAARRTIVDNGQLAHPGFEFLTRQLPRGTMVVEVPVGQMGAIHELEPGFLKGNVYILGALFHAEFIRVKYHTKVWPQELTEPQSIEELQGISKDWAQKLIDAEDARYNEDGEQMPWNEDPESMCYQWWHQTMTHVDECVFSTVEVPGFAGHYVLLIHPGSR